MGRRNESCASAGSFALGDFAKRLHLFNSIENAGFIGRGCQPAGPFRDPLAVVAAQVDVRPPGIAALERLSLI
jgi:hypothetical protein